MFIYCRFQVHILPAGEWCIFYQIRKIDGSPSVLHLFRWYWMILKAQRLAYTRKVIYKSVVESFGGKKILGNDFLFRYFWWWWGMQKTFPGIFFPEAFSHALVNYLARVGQPLSFQNHPGSLKKMQNWWRTINFSTVPGSCAYYIGIWIVAFFIEKYSKWAPRWSKNGHSRLHMSCTCV